MRIIKWLIGIVVVLAGVFVVGAFLLPREVVVARTVQIAAPVDKVFPHVNSLKATQAWSPWLELDPDVKTTFTGAEEGVGAKMTWSSEVEQVGTGSQEIIASVPNEKVETSLDFGPMGKAVATYSLVAEGEETQITWGFVTDTGMNPMARWFGLMLDGWVGPDYEKGLGNLKTLVESEG